MLSMTPGSQAGSYKVCPQCGLAVPLETVVCPQCGHAFRQRFVDPQVPPPNATQMFAAAAANPPPGLNQQYLAELARRSNEARRTLQITFFVGLFCLWPVWIVTYLEYVKMRDIKEEVGRMGVDVRWWQLNFQARDSF